MGGTVGLWLFRFFLLAHLAVFRAGRALPHAPEVHVAVSRVRPAAGRGQRTEGV